MRSVHHNLAVAEKTGYRVSATYTLPAEAWGEGYYDILEPRARTLADHPAPAVRGCAVEILNEIDIFKRYGDSYGYIFYVLQRQ